MTRITLSGLTARPLRTVLTTLAIVLGVALVSASFTLTDTMRSAAESLSKSAYDGTDAVVSTRTPFEIKADSMGRKPTIDASALERVRAVPGVAVAAGDVTTDHAQIVGKDGKPVGEGPYFGVGFDSRTAGTERLTPFRLQSGRWATGPGQVVLDAKTAEDEGYALGERVKIATSGHARTYEMVGVATFGSVKSIGTATAAVFDLAEAQRVFDKAGRYDAILVSAPQGASAPALRKSLAAALGSGVQVQAASEHDRFTLDGLDAFISIIRTVLLVFGLVAVLVGGFTILNTLSITVAQRTREYGLLRLAGASRSQVLRTVIGEALLLGLAASAVGVVAGVALAIGLDGVFSSLGLDLPEAGTVFEARTAIVAMLVGTLATLIAALVPARRATRVAPVMAVASASADSVKVGLFGRAFRAAASALGRPAERIGGPAGRLARRNAMRNPGRTGATAMALVIGVALVTAVTVVATGLKDSTKSTLDERISAGQVIIGQDGWSPTDPKIERELAATPGVRAVAGIRQDAALAFGDEEAVNAVDPATIGKVFDFEWAQGSKATLSELGADGAIVDEGWASEHGLKVGDAFTVTSPKSRQVRLVVRGIERSPVLDAFALGPITMSNAAFDGAFASDRNRFAFVDATDTSAVQKVLAAYPDAKVQTTAEFIDDQAASIDPLLAIFWVLLALCVLVSLFGIVNALVLSTFERMRELGTLRALGMSRRQVRRMVRHESVITALLGALVGIAAGLALAAVVTTVFADEGLTFAVPAGALVAFTIVAVLAGIAAAALPARRAGRVDVLTALAYE